MIEKCGYITFKHKTYILQYLIFPQPYLEIMKRAVTTKLAAYMYSYISNKSWENDSCQPE